VSEPVQSRGHRRRAALLDAAAALLAEGGFGAVSHRAVAERAELPLAATTYYFASRDDLAACAFEKLVRDELVRARERVRRAGGGRYALARALLTVLVPVAERSSQLALYELYVQAGRGDDRLRELAREWLDGCVALTGELLRAHGHEVDAVTARLLTSLADGLALELLVEDRRDDTTAVAVLTRALERMTSPD